MSVFLQGLSLKNYRGIGADAQYIGPFRSCNFFIGTNNSGKSCVLNFISTHLAKLSSFGGPIPKELDLSLLEVHLGVSASQVEVGIGISVNDALESATSLIRDDGWRQPNYDKTLLTKLLNKLESSGLVWFGAGATNPEEAQFLGVPEDQLHSFLEKGEWSSIWSAITGGDEGTLLEDWIPDTLSRVIRALRQTYPPAKLIPAKRQIGETGAKFDDFSGTGLIDKLAELQNPGPTQRELRKNFEKINLFLQDVTGDPSAMIEIPHDRKEVLVHKGPRVLPLSSLGTGIHEVVMIAAFCTLMERSIVCIEEPEIHLHPLLQKKLIRYINSNTDNQYFIATHSASIIDQPDAAVFHVVHENQTTLLELVKAPTERFRVCHDLGYRASDILQTNAIIWVEGPSDRIYLRHWISAIEPTFQEGIHYSIMFYGGRLLSHLSAGDEEISEFISLQRLNRNMAIIIDSDRQIPESKISNTKQRIIDEFSSNGGPAWLTAGREIENYIPPNLLEPALASAYTDFGEVQSVDQYAHRLYFHQKKNPEHIRTEVDKVKIARTVCQFAPDLSTLDLHERVSQMVAMIKRANT